jgi:hypothetical protein
MPLEINTEDRRTPRWVWAIVLLPLLALLVIGSAVYVKGYARAKALGASLVAIEAVVVAVEEQHCGGRSRHWCYRMDLLGSLDGVDHLYRAHDVPRGRFSYVKGINGNLTVVEQQRMQTILVEPHPAKADTTRMYWTRNDPVEAFKTSSTILLAFIVFAVFIFPFGLWASMKNSAYRSRVQ